MENCYVLITPMWKEIYHYRYFRKRQKARYMFISQKEWKLTKERTKRYRNTEKYKIRVNSKEYKQTQRECIKYHQLRRYHQEPKFKLRMIITKILGERLRRSNLQKCMTLKDYNIDINEIYEIIGNCPGVDYHLDHIKPCSAFDFSNKDEIRDCFSPKNLRWILGKENIRKSNIWTDEDGNIFRGKELIGNR